MGSSLSVFCQSFFAISKFFQYLPKVLLFVLSVPYNHVLCYHLLLHCGQSLLAFVRSVKQSWRKSGARRTHRSVPDIAIITGNAMKHNVYYVDVEIKQPARAVLVVGTIFCRVLYTSRPCFPALLQCIIMEWVQIPPRNGSKDDTMPRSGHCSRFVWCFVARASWKMVRYSR